MAPSPPTFLPSTQVPAWEMGRHRACAVAPFREGRSAWAARLGQAWTCRDQVSEVVDVADTLGPSAGTRGPQSV